jgi:alkylation response protein AidB-like acyl-CoA dehydrogenase
MIARITDERKKAFGKKLNEHGVVLQWVAEARVNIDAARFIVLNAAIKIDGSNAKEAINEIALKFWHPGSFWKLSTRQCRVMEAQAYHRAYHWLQCGHKLVC